LQRLDHAVGNVHELLKTVDYIANFTGFHEFAEFTAEDIGTIDSGLNSMVLANNNEFVLLPVNEPTFGTKRKSQIQTYLEQNNGPGLQHLALKTNDIFATVREMRKYSFMRGGFDFQAPASDGYYQTLKARIGDALTDKEYALVEELGLLVDRDDQGVLIQVFTKPVSDRPTIFLEIIQRVGCMRSKENSEEKEQAAGCGGFGKGNFTELFKSIEAYEKTLEL
jgi:4-hydroxyphenylpyruvate dioxygenase